MVACRHGEATLFLECEGRMDAAYCSRKRWPVDGLVQRVNSIYDGLDLWIASDGIEGDPQKPVHIVTVRGVGYKLVPQDKV